jgi:hypothetical protein
LILLLVKLIVVPITPAISRAADRAAFVRVFLLMRAKRKFPAPVDGAGSLAELKHNCPHCTRCFLLTPDAAWLVCSLTNS